MFDNRFISTVWSAAPTPLLDEGNIDRISIERLAEHHAELGIKAVFIGGTCGEGPLLSRASLHELAEYSVKANTARGIATMLQITDNSAERMIENVNFYADAGIDLAVIAPPFIQPHAEHDQEFLYQLYMKVIEASPVPVGLYHRRAGSSVIIEPETIARLAEHPKVLTLKDSACTPHDTEVIIAVRDSLQGKKPFYAYNGNEFDCVGAALNGYNGMMIGGGCFNGRLARKIFELAKNGNLEEAKSLQERLNTMMYDCFGGKNIACWLAGEKQLMVELGIFSTNTCLMNYQLTPECAEAIKNLRVREAEYL